MADENNIFLKKVWGMFPSSWPVVSCHYEGSAESLIKQAKLGDLILHVVSDKKEYAQRGFAIGLAEFAHEIVNTKDFIDKKYFDINEYPKNFTKKEEFKWQYSVPILRAWQFPKPIPYRLLFEQYKKERYDYQTRSGYAKLDTDDAKSIFDIAREEVEFENERDIRITEHKSIKKKFHSTPQGATLGPAPSFYLKTVDRTFEGAGFTYALRFSNSSLWKIGRSNNLNRRLKEINKHIPSEILDGQEWKKVFEEKWDSETLAHTMEQEVLKLLHDKRTQGERVQCSEEELKAAWAQSIVNCRKI